MGASPQFKIYKPTAAGTGKGEYVAACKYASDAAVLVSVMPDGATVRYGHGPILWTVGAEDFDAGESFDGAAEVMFDRLGWK